ncbi:GAF domain-containing protein [Hyalangium versicolor]|uniref:GAF domain-containing protein n=1 Tax=Hyalangium versicolor TaxID=2861190 RepID=UPI001CCAD9F8|nr:GAF domain-containing protein [Hyalangium versicolor]
MSVPESSLVAAVERMARALEQLATAPSVRAVLDEVMRSARATLLADHGSVSWVEEDGSLRTVVTPGLSEDVATSVAVLLLRQTLGTAEAPQPYELGELHSSALLAPEPALRERLDSRALLAYPVFLADGTRVGVLMGWFRQPHARVREDEVQRFALYARLTGIALAKDRMMEEVRGAVVRARAEAEQAEVLRLSRFQAVTEAFGRALTRTQVARAVLDQGLPAVGAAAGSVHMVAPDGRDVELVASVGLAPEVEAGIRHLPREGRMAGHDVARTAAPVWLESPEELHARYPEFASRPGMDVHQSFAFLPLQAEGRVMGVIGFGFAEPKRFTVPEQASILGLARQCGLALERALLYEREHAARLQAEAAGLRLRLLADASILLSRPLDWEQTVEGVARLAVGPFADLCIVDALEDGVVRRLAVLHVDPARADLAHQLKSSPPDPERSIISEVLRTADSHFTPRVTPDMVSQRIADPRVRKVVRELGIHSFIATPLITRERTLGVLTFVRGQENAPYTLEDVSLAEELARRAALAMDNARLFRAMRAAEEESRQSATRLHLLVRVSQLVAEAGLNLGQVLEVLVREVAEAIGDGCILQLVSEDGHWLEPAAVHHPQPEGRKLLEQAVVARRMRVGEGLQGAATSTGQTIILSTLQAQTLDDSGPEAALRAYLQSYGPQCAMVVALVAHGHACGSLLVLRAARGRPYGRDDQMLLESIANRAALAIEDARLYGAALQALRQRDDFLSVAGHELKNPLNALQLQLRVLARKVREDKLSESMVERTDRVARTGERLGLLIEDLLDMSRISAGQLRLQRSEVDLSALARDGINRMAEELARVGCEVRVEAEQPVMGSWDKLRLEQVVMNLLSNAAKYGHGRPVRVRVEAAPAGLARLSVRDCGYGIAPEDHERIFQRFQRADATRHIQGLGLGLWICRQIAESHGGTLRVESVLGEGSTFFLELPRTVPEAPAVP